MNDWQLIALGMTAFTVMVMLLLAILLVAKSKLVVVGNVKITINDDAAKSLVVPVGGKLLNVLADHKIYLSSACGGSGTCGQCRVIVKQGGGDILQTELAKLDRRQVREKYRLSCQVTVKDDLSLELPAGFLDTRKWECTVASNRCVATFIKELILDLPPGEQMDFRAGGYIQIEAPPHRVEYSQFEIADRYKAEWDRYGLWRYVSESKVPVVRAYSMANYPGEKGIIMLNVRISTPPSARPDSPPGVVSSYIYSRRPGDKVIVAGPFGEFFALETNNEMIFVGGGSGMAPMRSHIFDQLKRLGSKRQISYWYGARNLGEVFYSDDFERLAAEHPNFRWEIGLSEPRPEDQWEGPTGFIHQILYDRYLKDHPAPEDCEYYLCGPPMMISAVIKMLDELGVPQKHILFDDFS